MCKRKLDVILATMLVAFLGSWAPPADAKAAKKESGKTSPTTSATSSIAKTADPWTENFWAVCYQLQIAA